MGKVSNNPLEKDATLEKGCMAGILGLEENTLISHPPCWRQVQGSTCQSVVEDQLMVVEMVLIVFMDLFIQLLLVGVNIYSF